ncbi:MAG: hypothetical protein ACRD2C_09560 [Acidimicrobiales bacterium]
MRRKRKSVAVSLDVELLEAGRAVAADGRAWSFSALVNEALRLHLEDESPRSGRAALRRVGRLADGDAGR